MTSSDTWARQQKQRAAGCRIERSLIDCLLATSQLGCSSARNSDFACVLGSAVLQGKACSCSSRGGEPILVARNVFIDTKFEMRRAAGDDPFEQCVDRIRAARQVRRERCRRNHVPGGLYDDGKKSKEHSQLQVKYLYYYATHLLRAHNAHQNSRYRLCGGVYGVLY